MKATWPACFHRFFSALVARGEIKPGAPGSRTEWSARCPAHDDTVNSLSVGRGRSGALVVKCHAPAGCTTEAIVKALGVSLSDLYADADEKRREREAEEARLAELARTVTSGPAARYVEAAYRDAAGREPVAKPVSVELPKELLPAPKPKEAKNVSTAAGQKIVKQYDYRDESGNLLFQCVRTDPKGFRQRRPNPAFDSTKPPSNENPPWLWSLGDVRRVLYRLPELLKTWADRPKKLVCVVEGEKDADLLMAAGILATTCPMGAGKWADEYTETLRGRFVVVVPDEDPVNEAGYSPGLRHAYDVARRLAGVAAEVRLVRLPGVPPKGDVSDWWMLNADPAITVDAVKAKFAELIKAAPVFDPAAPPPAGALPPDAPALPGTTAAAPLGTMNAKAENVQPASPPPPAVPPTVPPPPAPPVAPPPPPAVVAGAVATPGGGVSVEHKPAPASPTAVPGGTGLGSHPNVGKLFSHAVAAASAMRENGVKIESVAQLFGMLRLGLGRIERGCEESVFTGNGEVQQRQLGYAIGTFAGILALAAADTPTPLETGSLKPQPTPSPAKP